MPYTTLTQLKTGVIIKPTIQTIAKVAKGLDGEYYSGDNTWDFIKNKTGVDLLSILENIARKKTRQ